MGVPAGTRGALPTDVEARRKFLAAEGFARLPREEQVKGLGDFYRGATLNEVALMILSSSVRMSIDLFFLRQSFIT
jgi:hypothetical protein